MYPYLYVGFAFSAIVLDIASRYLCRNELAGFIFEHLVRHMSGFRQVSTEVSCRVKFYEYVIFTCP